MPLEVSHPDKVEVIEWDFEPDNIIPNLPLEARLGVQQYRSIDEKGWQIGVALQWTLEANCDGIFVLNYVAQDHYNVNDLNLIDDAVAKKMITLSMEKFYNEFKILKGDAVFDMIMEPPLEFSEEITKNLRKRVWS
jgi:hypothetical protein